MAPVNIPGFYYDESKKRYFKIMPNHLATQDSPYSQEAVQKKAWVQTGRKRDKLFEEKKHEQRTQRSKVLGHPLLGHAGLAREGGGSIEVSTASTAAWVQGLERTKDLESIYFSEIWPPTISPVQSSALFAHDETTGIFVVGSSIEWNPTTQRDTTWFLVPTNLKAPKRSYISSLGVVLNSLMTSLTISPSRVLLTTAMGSGTSTACLHLARFNSPDTIYNGDFSSPNTSGGVFPGVPVVNSDRSVYMSSYVRDITYWASAARPVSHRSDFALATSSGTRLIAEDQTGFSIERGMKFRPDREVDILAVDWLNENVVLNGSRDGFLRLWDVRINALAGSSTPLKHPTPINHVRNMNGNRIAVAGIKNTLCVYDMRYLRPLERICPETEAFLDFPTYRNYDRSAMQVGLDVWRDRLIAVGTDDEKVQVFDAGTGKQVDVGIGGQLGQKRLGGFARCLKFVEGEGKSEGMRLYVAAGDEIQEWAW